VALIVLATPQFTARDFWHKQSLAVFLQETRMLSQVLNRAMPHSCNQLEEGVNRKEIIFYLAVQ